MGKEQKPLDLAALRERLKTSNGREYWRTLEELAEAPEFEEYLHREFPGQASVLDGSVDRRGFLRLMGASLALAGLGACTTQPLEKIIPYVRPPEQLVPGKPLFFTTAMTLGARAIGLLAESHMGRPTKIEGNPSHPASLGPTDAISQASVLTLYDPDRAQVVSQRGRIRSWSSFQLALSSEVAGFKNNGGRGLRLLTEPVSSPTLLAQIQDWLKLYPAARWHEWEPVHQDSRTEGTRRVFGRPLNFFYRLDQARVVVSFGSDLLCEPITGVREARDFMQRRRISDPVKPEMNRLYVIESTVSNTGSMADHRLAVRPSQIETLASALLQALRRSSGSGGNAASCEAGRPGGADLDASTAAQNEQQRRWIAVVARDLAAHRGESLVVAGEHENAQVHAFAHLMNALLGNIGRTVIFTETPEPGATSVTDSLRRLAADMAAGRVDTLVMIGTNPVYTAPVDLGFAQNLAKVRLKVHMSHYVDETSRLCDWHIPQTHFLEEWSDARAFDGTATIVQPLIQPLFQGISPHELLAVLSGPPQSGYQIIRAYWQKSRPGPDFERLWVKSLNDGVIQGTRFPEIQPATGAGSQTGQRPAAGSQQSATPDNTLEILFRPDPSIYDGRFANNAWLQELPKPVTKLTWDNAVLCSPALAQRMGLANEDMVELQYRGRKVQGPIWIVPGHADGCVTVHLGYGRQTVGRVGEGLGFNAYALRTADSPWWGSGLTLRKTGEKYRLACTQGHWSLEGRTNVRSGTLAEFQNNPHFAHGAETSHSPSVSLYPEYDYRGQNAWGMAIDLTACLGCNACVVACQAENNVPVVGKEQVSRQREMHWLRIDRYYSGSLDNPEVVHQPMLCQHCEKAPCEVVCPVAATVHSREGLNEMVYNRCVGTRYCSNNCPYKVRRFNFLQYSDQSSPTLQLLHNPDVTLRDRGVMEKCTYCVQRISAARIQAKEEDRPIRDGEVVTACQAACPTQAIVFGNINDSSSKVAKLKKLPLNYAVLEELNTQPRTTYLAGLKNPNPELESET
ncbi:MAG: TAT-variant-translocated molybdopterin oxidoreductase [Acidobacteriota bacterium]